MSNPAQSPAMTEAVRLLRAGDGVRAEEVMLEHVRRVEAQVGKAAAPYAAAEGELAAVLLGAGQPARAAEALRRATAGPEPADDAGRRERLTALMNLGEILERAGKVDEAEQVLRRGLEGRLRFYGREHPGYGFGLEPLAAVMLRKGGPADVAAALEMAEEAVRNFWKNRHPRVAGALALRAEALVANRRADPPFDGLEPLPEAVIANVAQEVIARVDRNAADGPAALKRSSRVLNDVLALAERRLGEAHEATLNVLVAVSNVERMLAHDGDQNARAAAIRRAVEIYEGTGRERDAVVGTLGLAVALSDAKRPDDALAAYGEASHRAERIGDAALVAQVQRNHGLLLAELKRPADAEPLLRSAADAARRSGDAEMLGRSLVALGIFLQHAGRLDEAKPPLDEALGMMDPAHPDAITARGHRGAIESGAACGCGDTGAAMAEAFRQFVLGRLPPDLLERLDVELKEGDFQIGVHVSREPTPQEMEQMKRVFDHALAEFRRRVLAGS